MSGVMAALLASGGGSFSISASPPNLDSGSNGSSFTTDPATVIISGGVGPFTKAWSLTATDGFHSFTITTPTAISTTFRIGSISNGDFCTATAQCVVNDTVGGGSAAVTVPITHQNTRDFGGPLQ